MFNKLKPTCFKKLELVSCVLLIIIYSNTHLTIKAQSQNIIKKTVLSDTNMKDSVKSELNNNSSNIIEDYESDESDFFIKTMKPEFSDSNARFYVLIQEPTILVIRLFDSQGKSLSIPIKKEFPIGCAIVDIPFLIPEDKEIVCCVKFNGRTMIRTFRQGSLK